MQQGVGENVRVDFHGVLDFIAATTAAAFGVGAVVEAFGRIDDDDLAVAGEAFEQGFRAGVGEFEVLDSKDGAEDVMIERDVLEAIVAENGLEFPLEGLAPGFVGAGRRGQQESAVFEVFLEVLAFLGSEAEVALAGHDHERDLEQLVIGELDRLEAALGGDRGFLLHGC